MHTHNPAMYTGAPAYGETLTAQSNYYMSYELLILCVIISQLHYFLNSHLQLSHGSSLQEFCIGVLTLDIIACSYMIFCPFKPHFRFKAGLIRSNHALCGPCQQCMLSTCSHSTPSQQTETCSITHRCHAGNGPARDA